MGIISWIKTNYYDSRLNKADRLAMGNSYDEAEKIYRNLFGKQNMAVVHLANMFATASSGVDKKLTALQSIRELEQFTDSENFNLYKQELNNHIASIENLSVSKFNTEQYYDAVRLIDSIIEYRKKDTTFTNNVHRFHSYYYFDQSLKTSSYSNLFESVINELKSYKDCRSDDIKYFVDSLIRKSFYSRAINLLYPLLSIDNNYKTQIINYLVEIILGKDKEHSKPQKISDFCKDKQLCTDASNRIYQLSNQATGNKEFKKSVLLDNFAAEFLTSDNNFNVSRCYHRFKELEQRADANEIKALLDFAKQLKLNEQQIDSLKSDIEKLAKSCEPLKGVNICRLFLSIKKFDIIYIEQAEKVAKTNPTVINSQELLGVISANSDKDSFVDIIAPFVKNIPSFSEQYVNSAIDKIIRHKSMPMFEKYWSIKEDALFFNRLISKESEIAEETVKFVASKHEQFLHSIELLQAFTSSIDSLNDDKFSYQSAVELYKNGCKVLLYIIDKTNIYCDNLSDDECITAIDNTLNVIDYLDNYQPFWIPLYLRKRKIQEKGIKTLSQRASFYRESIDKIINSSIDFREISEPSYFDLWQEYTNIVLKRSESQPKEKAIDDLTNVRGLIANYCKSYDAYTTLCKTLTTRIAKLRWDTAKELEEYRDFDNAMEQYNAAVCEGDTAYKTKADFRYLICAVKANKLTEDIEKNIKSALEIKSYQSLKDDLAYRYACLLLNSTRPGDAEFIIKTFLPTENQLLEICQNLYIKESENYLEDFNSKFDAISKENMSIQDAVDFLNKFSHYKHVISRNLQDTTNKFIGYRRKLESYIVKSFFDNERYTEAFKMLLKIFPNFFEDDTNFRNVAIASLGIIESDEDNITDDIRKKAISIWLSAIYSDKLFVKSLDYTSWDDQFTFTLDGSLGDSSYDDYEELPENVNFDEPIDNQNIPIAVTQNSLISRAENIIREKNPNLEHFFNQEKASLETLISLRMDESYTIASPYFANMFQRISESIKDAMDYELTQDYGNQEDVLSLGVKYGFDGGDYKRYKNAYDCAKTCEKAYGTPKSMLKATLSTLPKIKEFDKLYSSLKSFFSNKMNEAIKEEMPYSEFIYTFEIICSAFNDNTLSLGFSQYANGEVIHLLNNKTMSLREGIGLMVRIYNIAPSSIQVKKNLEGMLSSLASSLAEKPNPSDERVLNKALNDTGSTFTAAVEDARIQGALSSIIDKVNNNRLAKDSALSQIYNLYKKAPNNKRLCENLVIICDMCIDHYIIGMNSSSSVRRTLDALNANKSSTFKICAKKLADEFYQIWNALPFDTQQLISDPMGGILSGRTLNYKGEALKEALDYYKKLGGIVRTGSSIFDRFNGF